MVDEPEEAEPGDEDDRPLESLENGDGPKPASAGAVIVSSAAEGVVGGPGGTRGGGTRRGDGSSGGDALGVHANGVAMLLRGSVLPRGTHDANPISARATARRGATGRSELIRGVSDLG